MNEAVDRLISERERLDAGLPATMLASLVAHLLLVGSALLLPALLPRNQWQRQIDGFAVALPRGGGGSPAAVTPPATVAPQAEPEPPAPVPVPKVLKPAAEPPRPNALPALDSRRRPRKAEPQAIGRPTETARNVSPAGSGSATPGLEFGPPGPGTPDGLDTGGDWYLAGVQQKIWRLWNQQVKSGFSQSIAVTFTIEADGRVSEVRVTQPSGSSLLDMAAARAIQNAAPFGPLPREYGENRRTIQALFRP